MKPHFPDWPWRYWQQQQPERPAVRLADTCLNWQQLCQHIDHITAQLQQRGIQPQHSVALRGKNSPQLLLTLLALWQCGAKVLPLNPQLPPALCAQLQQELPLDYCLDLSAQTASLSLPAITSAISASFASAFPAVTPVATPVTTPAIPAISVTDLPPIAGVTPATPTACVRWQAQRLLSLILTSGSSGLPKAVAHSGAAHLACAHGVLALLPFGKQDCWLLSLPLFHVSGMGILWRWLLAGAQIAISDQPLATALTHCSHASLVPTQLWRLLQQNSPLPQLKAVLLGGASIATELVSTAQQRGIACWCGYGLTEYASTACGKRADGAADVGQPLAGCQLQINENEIWLRGDSLAAGYWRQGALQPLLNQQGWFATRDRGQLQNGRLRLHGRLDNLFFSGGESIQPEHIEQVIAAHPKVQHIFIVPLADAQYGHLPVAITDCPPEEIASLAQWCALRLANYQKPRHWLPLPSNLHNGGIKISRHQLQKWAAAQLAESANISLNNLNLKPQ